MPARELRKWNAYRNRKLLPWQRLEFYLAQIAQLIAITMGGMKRAKVADFLLKEREPDEEELTPEEQLVLAKEAFQFKPNSRKGKKGNT